jgi:hypothetical protein
MNVVTFSCPSRKQEYVQLDQSFTPLVRARFQPTPTPSYWSGLHAAYSTMLSCVYSCLKGAYRENHYRHGVAHKPLLSQTNGEKEKANKESRGKKQNEFLTTWKRKTDSLRRACTLDARVYEATEPQRLIRQPLSFSYQIESGIKYFPSNSIIFCLFRIFFKDGKTHRQGNKVLFFRLIFRRSFLGGFACCSRFDFGC